MIKQTSEDKLFVLILPQIIRYLFSKEVQPFLLFIAFLYIFMPFSTLVYIFLNIILTMMVYKLAFDVLAAVAQGDLHPKIKQNYLVTNGIAVKVFVVALAIEIILFIMQKYDFDKTQQFYFLAFSAFITPAIYMSLALTNSLSTALNPLVIHRVITQTIGSYFIFVGFWVATIYLFEKVINPILFNKFPVFLNFMVSAYIEFSFLILNFYIMGYILFQNRFNLTFITENIFESHELERQEDETPENPIHARIKKLLNDDEIEQALEIIKQRHKQGDETFELKELYDEALRLNYLSEKNRHLPEVQINKFLQKNQTFKAFEILKNLYNEGKEFKEKQAEDIYILAKYAKQSNNLEIVKKLIKNFKLKYPKHPQIVNNYFLLAQVMYEDRSQRKLVRGILQGLIKKHPEHELTSEIKDWLHGMKLMSKKD